MSGRRSQEQVEPSARHDRARRAIRGLILESVAILLEFGGLFRDRQRSHALAVPVERRIAAPPYRAIVRASFSALLVISVSALLLVAPIDFKALGAFGYLGVFLVTLITTGALVLPVPYLVVIAEAGRDLNPLLVALVAGLAAALGELTGYLLGFGGRELLPSGRWERAVSRWMRRHGFLTISIFAFIPNPAFDAAGVAAGALRYAIWRFVLACFVGKTAKFALVALFGATVWDSAWVSVSQALAGLLIAVGLGPPA